MQRSRKAVLVNSVYARQRHCTRNSKQIFPEMKLRLVPISYIYVSVSDLYIPMIGPPILQQNRGTDVVIYKSFTDTWMWKMGTQFLFWKYINRIFIVVCKVTVKYTNKYCACQNLYKSTNDIFESWNLQIECTVWAHSVPEAEFWDVIGIKVLTFFLLVIHSPL